MKKFIRSLLFFFGPPILLLALIFFIDNNRAKEKISECKFNNSINKLAIGDSHMMLAIDDSLVPGIKNLAHLSESFIYSYNKLVRLFESNPTIDTVYLGASYHSFAEYYDKHSAAEYIIGRYFFTMPFKEQIKLLSMSSNPVIIGIKITLRNFKDVVRSKNQMEWLGGFENEFSNTGVKKKFVDARLEDQYYIQEDFANFSDLNLEYFHKIASFCDSKSICLIVVNTPMHKDYKEQVPGKFKNRYYSVMKKLDVPLMEFLGLDSKLQDWHFTPDGDHMSKEGALMLSQYFGKSSITKLSN